jgi:hypothetical protein
LLLWLSLGFISGCAQKDSAVGSDLAPGLNDVLPQEMLLYPAATNFFSTSVTTGSSPFLYLGHTQGYNADALLKFDPYSSLPDSFQADSLVVKLFLDSLISSEAAEQAVSVYFINRSQTWSEIGVTWDNLDSLQLGDPFAQFVVSSAAADSDSVSFQLPAPDSLLHAWVSAGSGDKTLHFNNGIYLLSDKNIDFMTRFASAENGSVLLRPKLEMYIRVFEADTTEPGGYAQTDTMLYLYAGADAWIAEDFGSSDPAYLYLGNGAAFRSFLLFDLEDRLPTYGIAVQRAEIVLHADTLNAANLGRISSAFYLAMADTSWIEDPENATAQATSPVIASYNSTAARLTLNLTGMAYDWIRNPGTNYGVMIKSTNEFYDLSRTVFYGANAPDSLRPCLRLVYLVGGP